MTMIVERGIVDIENDTPTICDNSTTQLMRRESSSGDYDNLLEYSDCESSDLSPCKLSASSTNVNATLYKNDHISQYHSIHKLCTPTTSLSKRLGKENPQNAGHESNSVNLLTNRADHCAKVKIEDTDVCCDKQNSHYSECQNTPASDEDDSQSDLNNDECSASKRQRLEVIQDNSSEHAELVDHFYRPKRKQPKPQHCDDGSVKLLEPTENCSKNTTTSCELLDGAQNDLQQLQENINFLKRRYERIIVSGYKRVYPENGCPQESDEDDTEELEVKDDNTDEAETKPNRIQVLTKLLKNEISQNIELLIDRVVQKFVQRNYHQLEAVFQNKKGSSAKEEDNGDALEEEKVKRNSDFDSKEGRQNCSFSSPLNTSSQQQSLFMDKDGMQPLNYSLANFPLSDKKSEVLLNQTNSHYKAYLKHLTNPSYKALYALPNIQTMMPMFVPPFNTSYMFHNPNVYHPLFYHPSHHPHKQQETLKHQMSSDISLASEPEQSEAIPLIVNVPSKKKRTKVTDTRFSPRNRFSVTESSEHVLPTSQFDNFQNCQFSEENCSPFENEFAQKQSMSRYNQLFEHRSIETAKPSSSSSRIDNEEQVFPNKRSPSLQSFATPSNHGMQESSLFSSMYKQNMSTFTIREDIQTRLRDKYAYHPDSLRKDKYTHCEHHAGRPRSVSMEEFKRSDQINESVKFFKDSTRNRNLGSETSETTFNDQVMTSTLTPMHLRKAKLMFFYVRYPSSSVLKTYFPDVFFNKNNTAQLIKWFSNFREFYYIQMEKFARQSIAEGVKNGSNLHVTRDSELYRILVLHYNRNNKIEVPENFRLTVQATLREFFKAIQAERDQEQSWKKAIYKVIARLDDVIPEHFKRANWMEQLADT